MHPDWKRTAGEYSAPNFRFGGFVRAESVESDIDEHTCPNYLSRFAMQSLLGGFLHFENLTALIFAAFGAGAMGQFLLVAHRAFRETSGGEEVVRTAEGGAAC
jgi:hypothetical protein